MSLLNKNIIVPEIIQNAHTGISPVCNAIESDTSTKKGMADGLALSLVDGALSGDASSIDLSSLNKLFNDEVHRVVAHPFQQGIGQGGKYRTLSAPNAFKALGEKLKDGEFSESIDSAVVVLITAADFPQLQTKADEIGNFFMWPELITLSRHVRDLLLNDEYENPSVLAPIVETQKGLKESSLWSGLPELAALSEAQAEQSPVDELKTLLDEKAALSIEHENLLTGLASNEPTQSVHSAFVSGSDASDIGKKVAELTGVGHEQSHCCVVAILGTGDALDIWKEVFNG